VGPVFVFGNGEEEADEEEGDADDQEDQRELEGSPEPLPKCLVSFFGSHLVVFFVPKVGKRHDEQTQNCIERVEGVVDDLEGIDNVVDLVLRGPFFSLAQLRACGA